MSRPTTATTARNCGASIPSRTDRAPTPRRICKRAEATWKGEWWTLGGGGTVWDSMAYDPKLDLLYVGRGQWHPLEPGLPLTRRRRQSLHRLDHRAEAEDRRLRLALPDHPGRHLGLRRHPAHDPRGPRDRRPAAQRADAGLEERLLLRARPRHRRADLGGQLRGGHLGQGHRCQERATDRESRRAHRQDRQALRRRAGTGRRAQLAAHLV